LEEIMTKNTLICTLGTLAISVGIAGVASARTEPATAGTARLPGSAGLFSFSFTDGRVTSTGSGDFETPLTADNPGLKGVTVTCGASAAGAQLRAVGNDATGTMLSASAFVPFPILAGTAVADVFPAAVNVPAGGVLFVDAIMNNGSRMLRFNWNQ
jgi:hypothetical protein